MKNKRRYYRSFGFLIVGLIVALAANLMCGSVSLDLPQIAQLLVNPGAARDSMAGQIIWSIRLPRLLAAAFLGGALAVSGVLLQNFFGNPIVGPYVLGISSGAKLMVALVLILALQKGHTLGSLGLIAAAFLGSMLVTGMILLLADAVHRLSFLVICGVMVGYICSAITDILVTFADDSNIVNLHNWSMGSFSGIGWENLKTIILVVTAALAGAIFLSKPMAAYQLGEEYAASMGVKIRRFRIALILLSSLLSACVTAFAGPVSFVGIAVPHLVKSLLGTARPLLVIPASFLGGAVFCLVCDLIARTAFAPSELGIGTVTAVFGAPVVIAILIRRAGQR